MPTRPDPTDAAPGAAPRRCVVPRWVQLVLLPLAVLGVSRSRARPGRSLLLFIVAGLIALLLNPFVTLLRAARPARARSAPRLCSCFVLLVVGIGVLLGNPMADQVSAFRDDVPEIVDGQRVARGRAGLASTATGIDIEVKEQGQTALETLGRNLSEGTERSSRSRRHAADPGRGVASR